ncbi:MAG: hypothetical protein FWD36_01100 [Treponema sp.]|nr:hypothetical protein [Treponema sp.]
MLLHTPTLVMVIPCYNEEAVLPETVRCLSAKVEQLVSARRISEKSALLRGLLAAKSDADIIISIDADFRLMSRDAVDALAEYARPNIFLRGVIPLLQCTSGIVYYHRKKRFAGKSKYTMRKMCRLALDGIAMIRLMRSDRSN